MGRWADEKREKNGERGLGKIEGRGDVGPLENVHGPTLNFTSGLKDLSLREG